ncbi:MAG: PDZ domain-containing protein, partial [Rhizobiales bacterium]|nr:PDZ domain-containing protein [Hyphomicrobiales bacterium]
GLSLVEMTPALRDQFKLRSDLQGVVITGVAAGSSAEEKGIQPGEVVVEVAQEQVSKPSDIQARLDQLRKDGRKLAQFLIANPAGELRFVSLALEQ